MVVLIWKYYYFSKKRVLLFIFFDILILQFRFHLILCFSYQLCFDFLLFLIHTPLEIYTKANMLFTKQTEKHEKKEWNKKKIRKTNIKAMKIIIIRTIYWIYFPFNRSVCDIMYYVYVILGELFNVKNSFICCHPYTLHLHEHTHTQSAPNNSTLFL